MTHDIEVLRLWIRVVLVIASVSTTSFPIMYSFSPWRSRPLGRVLMMQGISFAIAMDLSTLFSFWTPTSILFIFWIDALFLTLIAISTSWLTWTMWNLNHPTRKVMDMLFTGRVYDFLKSVAMVWLPGAGTLYFTLAQIWHLPAGDEVVGSVVAVDTFLGILLGISTSTYNNRPEQFDGTMVIEDHQDGSGSILRMQSVDLEALAHKQVITFKVVQPQPAVPVPPEN